MIQTCRNTTPALIVLLLVTWLSGCSPSNDISIQRALWITRWDYQTAEEVRTAIDRAATGGFDTVFFQVRGNATVFYRSKLEPWAEEFGHTDPGFDPLQVAVQQAKKHKIALHAWINAIPGWRGTAEPQSMQHLYHTHPDWFLIDRDGVRQPLNDHYVALNPCRTDVRAHIVEICRELVSEYEISGLHLDYIRAVGDPDDAYPYDPVTLAAFDRAVGGTPDENPRLWTRWRTEQVSRLVSEIRAATQNAKPGILLTAAVFRTPQIALEFRQDWTRWLRRGWVDAVVPMLYSADDHRFELELEACMSGAWGRPVIAGLGVYLHQDPQQTLRQIEMAHRHGARGISLFAYASFYEGGEAGAQNATPQLRSQRQKLLMTPR